MSRGRQWLVVLTVAALGCDGSAPDAGSADAARAADGGATLDAGAGADAGGPMDAGASRDAGAPETDAAAPRDAGGPRDAAVASVSYTTNFDLDESPISEGGAWNHVGLDWSFIDTGGGIAIGMQPLGPRPEAMHYNDAYAYLSGFPPNQRASGVIHLGTLDGSCTHEVEILLRWSDSPHDAHGYEILLAWNGAYAEIVRWNGPLADYTYLARESGVPAPHEGSVLSAEIVGNVITAYLDGAPFATATDDTWTDGNPGIGLYRGVSGCGSLGDFAFTSYTASSIDP